MLVTNREYTVMDMHANDINEEEMAFDYNAVVYLLSCLPIESIL